MKYKGMQRQQQQQQQHKWQSSSMHSNKSKEYEYKTWPKDSKGNFLAISFCGLNFVLPFNLFGKKE